MILTLDLDKLIYLIICKKKHSIKNALAIGIFINTTTNIINDIFSLTNNVLNDRF